MSTDLTPEPLSKGDVVRLARLESKIERAVTEAGKSAGESLRSIRDDKLYRATHKSFDRYVLDRWGFSRATAYRMIGQSTEPTPVNEKLVRISPPESAKPQGNVSHGETKLISAASRVAPPKKSEEGEQRAEPVRRHGSASSGHLPQPSPVAPLGVDDAGGSGQSSGGERGIGREPGAETSANPGSPPAPPGPTRLPSDRELLSRALGSLRDIDPEDAGPVATTGDAVEVRQWADRFQASYRKAHKIPEPGTKPPAPVQARRQGTVSRPSPAKAEASTNGHREVKSYFKAGG